MQYTVSLKQNHIFRRLYAKGKRQVTPQLALYVRRNGTQINRLGLTTSTKLGNAVVRNRVRRRLRAIYRIHEPELCSGYDLVVVARVRAVYSKYAELDQAFMKAAKAIGLVRKEESH